MKSNHFGFKCIKLILASLLLFLLVPVTVISANPEIESQDESILTIWDDSEIGHMDQVLSMKLLLQ